MRLSGADIIVKTLIEQGCDTVFGYPGGQILNVYDSLYTHQNEINHILTAHEQGAAHAADGYARATGKVGVVISTSGPGATNLVTGIATACLDSVPIVAICGNVPTTQYSSTYPRMFRSHAATMSLSLRQNPSRLRQPRRYALRRLRIISMPHAVHTSTSAAV